MVNKVVARFLDGRVAKGSSLDLDPARPTFHLRPAEGKVQEVRLADLKAVYFVKDLTGNPAYNDGQDLAEDDARAHGAYPIELTFADGERLVGLTVRYPPVRPYFWVLPADTGSNNDRVLVNRAAVVAMGQPADREAAHDGTEV